MVVTYYIKLFCTGTDRHNIIFMSLLLLVAETIMELTLKIYTQRRSKNLNWHLQDFVRKLVDDVIMMTLISLLWCWRHYCDTREKHKTLYVLRYHWNMVHTSGLCGVLGFTAPLVLISKKIQSKYIYTLNSALCASITVTFGCLIDMGVAYKPADSWLIIFGLISWIPFTMSRFVNGNILSTPVTFH